MDSPAASSSQPPPSADQQPQKEGKRPLKLFSPYGSDAIYFQWHADVTKNCVPEIFDIMRELFIHCPDMKYAMENSGTMSNLDLTNYEKVRIMCKKFSKFATAFFKCHFNGTRPRFEYCNNDLLRLVIAKAYNRSVDNEKKLNKHYEAFSSETYGETSYERLASIIDEIKPTESDVFVDLGSGVGQLVVQMAGGSKVKRAAGIEIADLPASFARKMELEFKSLMKWFGRKYRPFQIHHGSFLDEKYRNLITNEATIIFINNYAFTAELDSQIKTTLLSDLKEGTRIITTKPYAPVGKNNVTHRTLSDVSAILEVSELSRCPNACSWTSNYVPYYLHVVDRTKLELYFSEMKARENNVVRKSNTPSSNQSSRGSRESSVSVSRNGVCKSEDIYGPTTRRKWNQYVNEMEKKRKDTSTAPSEVTDIDTRPATPPKIETPPVPAPKTPVVVDAVKAREDSIADTVASVADGTASTIRTFASPPSRKRPRKDTSDGKPAPRGRPRKNTGVTLPEKKPKISQEALEGMDIMHQLTSEACRKKPDSVMDPAFILTDVTHANGRYPNLDIFIDELRALYTRFLDSFQTEQFVRSLRNRDSQLAMESEDNTAEVTEQGISVFKAQMRELGVDMDKPREKVTRAKRFLERYNRVIEACQNLDNEMELLERESKDLILQYSKDTKEDIGTFDSSAMTNNSFAASSSYKVKMDELPRPMTQSMPMPPASAAPMRFSSSNNRANGLPVGLDQMMINNLSENLGQNNLSSVKVPGILQASEASSFGTSQLNNYITPSDIMGMLKSNPKLSAVFAERGLNISNMFANASANNSDLQNRLSLLSANSTASTSGTNLAPPPTPVIPVLPPPNPVSSAMVNGGPSTSATETPVVVPPVISEPTVNGTAKKSRPRTARANSNKKAAAPKNVENPAEKAEIDKHIMNIVQIALEVDKSAKSQAEKERKARHSEKRSKDRVNGSTSNTSTTHTSPGSKKRLSSESAHLNGNVAHTSTSNHQPPSNTSCVVGAPTTSSSLPVSSSGSAGLMQSQKLSANFNSNALSVDTTLSDSDASTTPTSKTDPLQMIFQSFAYSGNFPSMEMLRSRNLDAVDANGRNLFDAALQSMITVQKPATNSNDANPSVAPVPSQTPF